MSLVTKTVNSKFLNKQMNLSAFVPSGYENTALPVLYFLHGRSGNEKILELLGMDKTAQEMINLGEIKPVIIVCPNMDNSRGINSAEEYTEIQGKYGIVNKGKYEDYLIDEIMPFIDSSFNTLKTRENRFIGGVSSGGYNALHIAFRHKDLFSKVGGHMPAIDLCYEDEDECYFADRQMWEKYDPITIARQTDLGDLQVYLDDGKDDEGQFYRACEKLFKTLKEKNVKAENHLFSGHHNGEYVVSNMKEYLRFYAST